MRIVKCILFLSIIILVFVAGWYVGQFRQHNLKWPQLLKQDHIIGWASVLANLMVVFVALFLTILHEHYKRPRFSISADKESPYQVISHLDDENIDLLHVRLKIENNGRTATEACEVRLEHISYIYERNNTHEIIPIKNHDPRTLKWFGRDTAPIPLNAKAFDFVDLGVLRPDFLDNFRIEFMTRGHLDLSYSESDIKGFKLTGTIYSKKARPKRFTFDLSWSPFGQLEPVQLREAEQC